MFTDTVIKCSDRRRRRRLDDQEVDSGDNMDRDDRRDSPIEEDEAEAEAEAEAERGDMFNVMDLNLGRVAEPESTDGQVRAPSVLLLHNSD